MNILKLVADDNFITLNKSLIQAFDLEKAAIIGMFASMALYQINKYNTPWFYATYEKIEEQLKLKKSVASKAIDAIIEAGILIDKREGIPCRRHFKFQEDRLLHFLSCENQTTSRDQEEQQAGDILPAQVVRKSNDIYKNKDKNKEISLSDVENILREGNFLNVDAKKIFQYVSREKKNGLRNSVETIVLRIAGRPENQLKNISTPASKLSDQEMLAKQKRAGFLGEIEGKIKFLINNYADKTGDQYFTGFEEKGGIVYVTDKRALKYKELLAQHDIKIELENA